MSIQAVLFGISDWSTSEARKMLKNHNITPIKNVHKTTNFLRYRIKHQNTIYSITELKQYKQNL